MRTVTDVAALAWNIPIFDSSLPKSFGGPWLSVGGTSASAPLIAGVYALAGNAATIAPGYTYHHASHLFDVTTGNNALFRQPRPNLRQRLPVRSQARLRRPHRPGHPHGTGAF
jgi:hypothetical protein